jgi:hypothetical protein
MNQCLFCSEANIQNIPVGDQDIEHWKCERCGEVIISRSAATVLSKYTSDLWLLSAYCRNRSRNGLPPTEFHTANLDEIIKSVSKPSGILDAENRIVELFGSKSDLLGSWIVFDYHYNLDIVVKSEEFKYLFESLCLQGFIEINQNDNNRFRLTPKGWIKYEEIHRRQINSRQAFIAMNFDSALLGVYEQAIKAAVEEAGFTAYRIDHDRHVDNINNRIIAKIKESRFLIAEFTEHKHGVYFEAGFALGLGIPVIWVCQKSHFGKTHFDTKPFNHIIWETKEELKEELFWTIKANIS